MAAPVIIRVGCSIDTSVEKTFGDIERRATRAGKRVEQAMRPGRRGLDGAAAERAITRAAEGEAAARLRAFRTEARERQRLNRETYSRLRSDLRQHERDQEASARRAEAAQRRAARQQERELDRFARRTSHRSTRFFWGNAPLASGARRAAYDVMRGIGIDPTIAGAVGRATEMQRSATALSTQGYQMGAAGPEGKRVDPATLIAEARAVAEANAISATSALTAQESFTARTGDLATARALLGDMAALSGATGSTVEDLMEAAGGIALALGDGFGTAEEKAAAVAASMRTIAGQGKLGSVEAPELAKYMGKIAGSARAYEGDVGKTIEKLGALAQLSMGGGAWSGATATTAIASFTNTLKTPARIDAFKKAGVNVYGKGGGLRDPLSIIKESLTATGGDAVEMKRLFANVMGARAVESLTNSYNRAGRGTAGLAAVDAELARFLEKATMSQAAIAEANALRMKTTAAKAAVFQEKLDEIGAKAGEKLIPALEKLEPVVLRAADGLGRIVQWSAENPGKAIVAAIVASILRASLESTFRAAVERAILGGTVPGAVGGAVGGAGGAVGKAAAAGALGPAGLLAGLGVAAAWTEWGALQGNQKGGAGQVGANDWSAGMIADRLFAQGAIGGLTQAAASGDPKDFIKNLSLYKGAEWLGLVGGEKSAGGGSRAADRVVQQTARVEERLASVEAVLRGGLRVTNLDEIRPPTPPPGGGDPSGREGAGA